MSYTATWVLILISWIILWQLAKRKYVGQVVVHREMPALPSVAPVMAPGGPQGYAAATPAPVVDIYIQQRSETVQGLVGLGYKKDDCIAPVEQAQAQLLAAGQPVTTENLLRAVMASIAANKRSNP